MTPNLILMNNSSPEKKSPSASARKAELLLSLRRIAGSMALDGTFRSHAALALLEQRHPEIYASTIELMGGKDQKTKTFILHSFLAKGMHTFPEIEKVGDVKKSRNRFGKLSQCSLWRKKK